jgi:hypothetical protein
MSKLLAATGVIIILLGSSYAYISMQHEEGGESFQSVTPQKGALNRETGDVLVYETDADSANDCSSKETFDAEHGVCRFECSTEAECASIQAQIDTELGQLSDEYVATSKNFSETPIKDSAGAEATYSVTPVEKITLASGTQSKAHTDAWELFSQIVPDEFTNKYVDLYEAQNNAKDDTLAYVQDHGGKFSFGVNFGTYGKEGKRDDVLTLVHEFTHILTLNDSQVEAGNAGACGALYDTGDGCALKNSYLQKFVENYWSKKDIREAQKGDASALYTQKPEDFVTEYAATSPEEDIAESFALFVLDTKPEITDSAAKQKISFFYQYPELTAVRAEMRRSVGCVVLARKRR